MKAKRPTIGDKVRVIGTESTFGLVPVGTEFVIDQDANDYQPYHMKEGDWWFFEDDVELVTDLPSPPQACT